MAPQLQPQMMRTGPTRRVTLQFEDGAVTLGYDLAVPAEHVLLVYDAETGTWQRGQT